MYIINYSSEYLNYALRIFPHVEKNNKWCLFVIAICWFEKKKMLNLGVKFKAKFYRENVWILVIL